MSKLCQILIGNNLDILPTLAENSIDSIVTDPPYGLEFMGKDWDAPWKAMPSKEFNEIEKGTLGGFTKLPNHSRVNNVKCEKCEKWKFSSNPCTCEAPSFPPARQEAMQAFQDWCKLWAIEAYRILKPGGHMLAFSGSRTYHRMTCAIEDAGFEVRDQMMWVYGSGFPKSHNISKALDKQEGMEPTVVGRNPNSREDSKQEDNLYEAGTVGKTAFLTEPASEIAKKWEGWGTALKPSHEPIVLARKPLQGTVADNIRKWGVGGLNIDACRVGTDGGTKRAGQAACPKKPDGTEDRSGSWARTGHEIVEVNDGRWPANLMHDGSQEVLDLFPESNGGAAPKKSNIPTGKHYEGGWGPVQNEQRIEFGSGSAARFFYCPKANKRDRDEGCEGLETKDKPAHMRTANGTGDASFDGGFQPTQRKNIHPTVKPTELMRYLCKLITPPGGLVLDPFMGSGSTGRGAILEGFNFIGVELSDEYAAIAKARIDAAILAKKGRDAK